MLGFKNSCYMCGLPYSLEYDNCPWCKGNGDKFTEDSVVTVIYFTVEEK